MEMQKENIQMPWARQVRFILKDFKKVLLVGCGILCVQQATGIACFISYGPIFIAVCNNKFTRQLDLSVRDLLILSMPLAFVRILGTFVATQVVDHRGRRTVLLKTIPILGVSLALAGVGYVLIYTRNDSINTTYLGEVIAYLMFICFNVVYSAGLQNIPWLYNAEIYPITLIGAASSLASASSWIMNAITLLCFLMPSYLLMFIFSLNCLFGWIFVYFLVKETLGHSILMNVASIMGIRLSELHKILKNEGEVDMYERRARSSIWSTIDNETNSVSR